MPTFIRRLQRWCYGLVAGCIVGGAQAILSWGGFAVAHNVGLNVPQLNWKSAQIIFLAGVVTHGAMFVTKNRLPALDAPKPRKHKHHDYET